MIPFPLLIALDAAVVLILAVLIAEFAHVRKRRPERVYTYDELRERMGLESTVEFMRPPEWGPVAVSRDIIDHMRDALLTDQLIAIADRRYSKWTDAEKRLWVREWVDHDDDYALSITGRGIAWNS